MGDKIPFNKSQLTETQFTGNLSINILKEGREFIKNSLEGKEVSNQVIAESCFVAGSAYMFCLMRSMHERKAGVSPVSQAQAITRIEKKIEKQLEIFFNEKES